MTHSSARAKNPMHGRAWRAAVYGVAQSQTRLKQLSSSSWQVKESEVAQSCPTLCNTMDCSPPGSSVRVILQARILEWVALSSSRRSSDQGLNLCLPHCRQTVYHLSHQGSPLIKKTQKYKYRLYRHEWGTVPKTDHASFKSILNVY